VGKDREEDQVLVLRVQRGDEAAFNVLVAKYRRRLLRLAGRMVNNRSEAEDIAQETFIRAYRALKDFRGDAAFYTWLYRIGVNTARSQIGRCAQPPHADLAADRLAHLDTPEEVLHGKQLAARLALAFDALPMAWRTAIVLRELDGLSYQQIAAVMQCPVGTVRSRIARARNALAERLQLAGR
jgi:RNA polymerase sigma-70 factor, ECF subfamily